MSAPFEFSGEMADRHPTPAQRLSLQRIRLGARDFANVVMIAAPLGPARTLAFAQIRTAMLAGFEAVMDEQHG